MPDLYLHIGLPKTGTSSIQVFLRDNPQLLEKIGYCVPQIGQGRAGGHHTLVRTLAGLPVPPHQAVAEADILKELDQAAGKSVLISSEMLTGMLAQEHLADALLSKLRRNGMSVILVFYVRNQTQWINSVYGQGIKSFRQAQTFSQFVKDVLSNTAGYSYKKWIKIAVKLGVELRVQPFTKLVRTNGVIRSYLQQVGVATGEPYEWPARINDSAGPFTVEAARRLMSWVPGGVEGLTFMQSTRSKLALAKEIESMKIREPSYCGLDTDTAATIEAAFADDNDQFALSVWNAPWSKVFEDDIAQEFSSNDYQDTGVPEEMREALEIVVAKLQTEITSILRNPRLAVREEWNARRA